MAKKVTSGSLTSHSKVVPPIELEQYDKKISFSFKFLRAKDDKFRYQEKEAQYFLKLIEKFQSYSGWSILEAKTCRSDSMRCHPIKWPETTETGFGIPKEEEICAEKYQFSVSANEHGRVHGFFILNVFYIVWFDPNHELYN